MFVCKVCGNEVKAGQAFCPTCGADVVENYETICPVCKTKNSAGSKFCAKCGGILQSLRKPVCSVCGAKNLPGAAFCVTCGAPIKAERDTHSDADMIDARKAKRRLDNMERERMAAVDKEIAEMRAKTAEERELAMQEVDQYRMNSEEEYGKKARMLEAYRTKLNELGAEDVEMLKNVSTSLKGQAKYYADPYTQIDEDEIDGDVYVCPACGTINPNTATVCSHCGRNKARAQLLLAKGKIKQSPPIKRKKDIIPAPENNLERTHVPTLDEFIKQNEVQEKVEDKPVAEEKVEQADFSGPHHNPYGNYPYPPYPYPYPPYPYCPYSQQAPCGQAKNNNCENAQAEAQPNQCACAQQPSAQQVQQQGQQVPQQAQQQYTANMQNPYLSNMPYQMPPIVQPVAFVPYVTQEQPLVQYSPVVAEQIQTAQPVRKTARVTRKTKK